MFKLNELKEKRKRKISFFAVTLNVSLD